MVVFVANAGHKPPHGVGGGVSSLNLRQVGGCGFKATWPHPSSPVQRGPRELRPVENRSTAHGARAHWRPWRGCLRCQRRTRSTPHRWRRRIFIETASGTGCSARARWPHPTSPVPRCQCELRPVENRRTTHGALADSWRGCLRCQCSNAGRAPPHAVDRGVSSLKSRQVGGCGFEVA